MRKVYRDVQVEPKLLSTNENDLERKVNTADQGFSKAFYEFKTNP